MCGIAGIALHERGASVAPERLAVMARSLVHRGPDDEGILARGRLGAAFRRLSIIDLQTGHQPILNETEDVAVVCNGEIYNFRELRAELQERGHRFRTGSDVETILHLYEEEGEALATRLVGMYAFALLDWRDERRPRLLLGRDRLGIKPLYYARTAEGLFFASEPKAILAAGAVGRRLVPSALLDYLVQGWCSGPSSAWEGVLQLPPAHTLAFEPGGEARPRRYWDLPLDGPREPAAPEEILEWLDRCVREHMIADVPLGAFLSGGIDSSAVVSSMAAASSTPVIACSVGFRERSHDELELAHESARRLRAVHHCAVLEADPAAAMDVLPWHFDEPLADPSTVPTHLVSRMAREHVTVALSGDGGDEVFAGYRRYVYDLAEQRVRRALGRKGTRLLGWVGAHYPRLSFAPRVLRARSTLQNLGRDPARAYWSSLTQMGREEALALLAPELRAALGSHDPFDAFRAHYERPSAADPLYRAQYADFQSFLPDRILAKTDRASMAVSLEVRVPLLDHRFVERFVHLPAREKVRGGRGKHALRAALRGRVPERVLAGPKKGFDTPLERWIRGALGPAVEEALESLPGEWFERSALRRLYGEHRSRLFDHSGTLWTLFVLEHWRRRHDVTGLAASTTGSAR